METCGKTNQYQVYVEGDFSFVLKTGAIPFITVKDCLDDEGRPMKYYGLEKSKKLVCGQRTKTILWTLEEWNLLDRCYLRDDVVIHAVYMSAAEMGYFKPAIQEFFDGKENSPKDSVQRALYKLDLNGATHGRAMIRLMTSEENMNIDITEAIKGTEEFMSGVHVVKNGKWEENHDGEPSERTNPLVGMTAMSHARCRLIEHCMTLIEHDYMIYMNDTDSLITDCPPDVMKKLLDESGWNNWIIDGKSKEMDDTLGRFEVEDFKLNGIKYTAFDEFRCWGLKRYAEIMYTDKLEEGGWQEGDHYCVLRKSAFAGMHDEDQKQILGQPYMKQLHWYSTSKKWTDKCYALRNHIVEAEAEDVFAHGY